jgi:hypothetical protein
MKLILSYEQFILRRIDYTPELFGIIRTKNLYAQADRRPRLEPDKITLFKVEENINSLYVVYGPYMETIHHTPSGIVYNNGYLRLIYVKEISDG